MKCQTFGCRETATYDVHFAFRDGIGKKWACDKHTQTVIGDREILLLMPIEVLRDTLESCICGEHFDCPDGYHSAEEMPCICTADCVVDNPELHDFDDDLAGLCTLCEQSEEVHR